MIIRRRAKAWAKSYLRKNADLLAEPNKETLLTCLVAGYIQGHKQKNIT
jgi:hypothetical protein